MAWLSDDTQGPAARFLTKGGPRPYHRLDPDAPLVATNWADLTDGTLVAPIDRDATGASIKAPHEVWTNTTPAGAPSSIDNTCDAWTLGAGSGSGNRGSASASDSTWTERDTTGCQSKLRIYCVEQ
ncbi:MAG TPA: hypothetical protein PKW35_06890 [Nannocystaceae bacterium]|nr:hypothetical protein [Nannocystaceae bacterium]